MFRVIKGVMFSEKTISLLEFYFKAKSEGEKCFLLKPVVDTRSEGVLVASRKGLSAEADYLIDSEDRDAMIYVLHDMYAKGVQSVFIDEVQFLGKDIEPFIFGLLDNGVNVTVAGLEFDSDKKVFGSINYMQHFADEVVLKQVKCNLCSRMAEYTKRVDSVVSDQICVGSSEYEPRCAGH